MIDLDRNTGSMFVYAFTQFENVLEYNCQGRCEAVLFRWNPVENPRLRSQQSKWPVPTFGSLLIVVNMKETHFTICSP